MGNCILTHSSPHPIGGGARDPSSLTIFLDLHAALVQPQIAARIGDATYFGAKWGAEGREAAFGRDPRGYSRFMAGLDPAIQFLHKFAYFSSGWPPQGRP